MIVIFAGPKGGTGKSTGATNCAAIRAIKGRDVLLYDVDPQRTSTLWGSRRDENGVQPRVNSVQKVLDGKKIFNLGVVTRNDLKALLPKYEDIIIDAGGADTESLRAAMTLADQVIFPVSPSEFDMWTFSHLSNLVASAQGGDRNLVGKILLNKVNVNPPTARSDIDECDDFLTDFENLVRLDSVIRERVSIRRASGKGLSIIEYFPADKKAEAEILGLYKEIFND